MAPFARMLAGAATAALLAAVLPAFAAPSEQTLAAPREASCDSSGVTASFGLRPGDSLRLDHVRLDGMDAGCVGHIVTVEIAGLVQQAAIDGPRVVVPIEGDVPASAATAIAVSVRRPGPATR